MKMLKKALFCATGAMLMASAAQAQELAFDTVQVNVGAGTADVAWTYTPGASLTSISVDVPEAAGTLLTGVDLTNCLLNAVADLTACNNNAGTVRITLTNFVNPLVAQDGVLTFTLDPGAVGGDSEIVDGTAVPGGESPPGTPVTITDGSVTVVAATAILNVTPANISFGNQQTGTPSAPQVVTVSNDGTDGVDLTLSAINFTGDFAQTGGTCTPTSVLADAASCTIEVTFTPSVDGVAAGDVTVVSDAATTTNDTTTFDGTGVPGPQPTLDVNPATAAFGTVDLGNMPQAIVHTVTNTGDPGSTLTFNSIAYTGDAEFSIVDTCPASLAEGESCTITVTFDAAANGVYSGTVDVSTNAGDAAVPVTGTADSVADLVVNPPFGPVDLGTAASGASTSANGALTNNGSADGAFSCSLSGPDAAVFATTPSPLSGTVPAGDSVPFTLTCNVPSTAIDGDTFAADLVCTGDNGFSGTHNLSCGALNVPMIPVPTMQPWALVLFSMLMLIAGGLGIRFFRAQ